MQPTVNNEYARPIYPARAVQVAWPSVDAVDQYFVWRDGLFLGASQQTSLIDMSPGSGIMYQYQVSAVDFDGHQSALSAATAFTTVGTSSGTSTISGIVWYDTNGNMEQDPGESGAAGVTVRLSGGVTTTTNSSGAFSFDGLAAKNNYEVYVEAPSGYVVASGNPWSNYPTNGLQFALAATPGSSPP
jgi:hypothetical protein